MAAASSVRWEKNADHVAVATIDQPGSRANTLGQAVLADLEQMLAEIEVAPGIQGLVFRSGKPGMFVAGADLKELGSAEITTLKARDIVRRGLGLIHRIEALPYPTVAAVEGACLGGGLELALAFDARILSDHPRTELGCPEVKIGLIPGWGGTQRLPRLVGAPIGVEMVAGGEPVNARRAVEIGLAFDVVPSERLLEEALRLVGLLRKTGDWQKARMQKRQPIGLTEEQHSFIFQAAKAAVLAKTKGQLPAPAAAVEVVEQTCNKPLEEGLKIETEAFVKLLGSPISRNLIAVFFMNQRIAKDPGVADPRIPSREIGRVGVLGAGLMGSGIAAAFIRKGIHTLLLDSVPAALEKGIDSIQKGMAERVAAGRMKAEEMAAALARLSSTLTLDAFRDRQLAIEAVVENEEVKLQVFRDLQERLPADALIASNTSTISISRMARAIRTPELFAGMHFFNPVDRMPLVEVIRGDKTGDEAVVTLVALAKRIGKSPIVVKDCPGFLVNRVLFPYLNEALVLLEEGAAPRAVDKAATAFGMPMGPVTLYDVVGLDTSLYAGRVINTAFADRAAPTRLLDELVRAGRLGQKSAAGFYSYARDPKKGDDDPAFLQILDRCRTGKREVSAEEMTERLFLTMFCEATRVLEEGIVREPADVDMGLILGIGFPAWRGGIFRWADSLGKDQLLRLLGKYQHLGRRYEAVSLGRYYPN